MDDIEDENKPNLDPSPDNEMIYDYFSRPKWFKCLIIGFQHFITMCLPSATGTILIINNLCDNPDQKVISAAISNSFFCMGITTLLQTFTGVRLPIIQGATYALVLPALAAFSSKQSTFDKSSNCSHLEMQMSKIGTSMMTASLLEILIGFSGLISLFVRFISPLSLSAIFITLALAIVKNTINLMGTNWPISLMATAIMLIVVLVLAPLKVPCCVVKAKKCICKKMEFFQFSPILISLAASWIVCGILTVTNAFSKEDKTSWQYAGRVDSKLNSFTNVSWIRFPLNFRISPSTFEVGMIITFMFGILVSIVESTGDYLVTAKICNAPHPPNFAVNRGIVTEGFGVLMSSLLGSLVGPTSYSDNIGLIKVTKVGNRAVTQTASAFMIICGFSPMLGAFFNFIPIPAIGGVSVVVAFMIVGVGAAYLQQVNLNVTRNILIFACSVGFGIYIPIWVAGNQVGIESVLKYPIAINIITTLFSVEMLIAGFLSILMDNIIPGTYKNLQYLQSAEVAMDIPVVTMNQKYENQSNKTLTDNEINSIYDNMAFKFICCRFKFLQYLPVFPRYTDDETVTNHVGVDVGEMMDSTRL